MRRPTVAEVLAWPLREADGDGVGAGRREQPLRQLRRQIGRHHQLADHTGGALGVAGADRVTALLTFYRDGLALEVLYEFKDHNGFDEMMSGRRGAPYHLEFTRAKGHAAGRAPTQDNVLVFYIPGASDWRAAISRMQSAGSAPVPSFNAYRDEHGRTFEDSDGYRVVIQQASWNS